MRILWSVWLLVGGSLLLAPVNAQETVAGARRVPERQAVINFEELARLRMLAPANTGLVHRRSLPRHGPARPTLRPGEATSPNSSAPRQPELLTTAAAEPSPPPTTSFLALTDDGTAIPPDTMGAVGPNHLVTTLNSQVRIQDRSGTVIRTVSLDSFWSSLGNYATFDPRIVYDPFANRWICTAAADSGLPTSAVLVGVTATGDPTGTWYLFSAAADVHHLLSADYDSLGFNKQWIAVSVNLFPNNGGPMAHVAVFVFAKADLYANGTGAFTELTDQTSTSFALVPAATYDNSLDALYLVEDWDGSQGQLRISTITGPVGGEVLTIDTGRPTTTNRWDTFPARTNPAPQFGSTRGIDLGDSRLLSCQYRNGSLWCAQNAFLPANAGTRGAAQWWQLAPEGAIEQFGRRDDPTGLTWYGYPSVAANDHNDMLIGYSRFSPTQFPSANYSLRLATDPPNTLRADTVLEAGEGTYVSTDTTGLNRWGDFSATMVDPVNGLSFWTIQEFAGAPSGNPAQDGSGQWGTWWGRIDPDLSALILALARPADGLSYPPNPTITITATNLDPNTVFTLVEFFADNAKIGETNAAPFAVVWPNAANGPHTLQAIGTESSGGQATSTVVNISVGDTASPLGLWETQLSGLAKGTVYLGFNDDFSLTGYGMGPGSFGLFTITGQWSLDQRHQLAGTFSPSLGGIVLPNGSLTGKVQKGSKLTATVTPSAGRSSLKFSGAPAITGPDLTGTWTAHVQTGKTRMTETYQLTPSATFFNLFDLTGLGDGYTVSGSALVTARGQVTLSTTNGQVRSLAGKLNLAKHTATLTGADALGHKTTLQLTSP